MSWGGLFGAVRCTAFICGRVQWASLSNLPRLNFWMPRRPTMHTRFSPADSLQLEEVPIESEALDLVGILSAVEETAYTWDLQNDRLDWESNALAVLGVGTITEIATGAGISASDRT